LHAHALALCKAGRFAEAEPVLRQLVASDPSHAEAMQLLGVAVSSLGRVDESLQWFDRAAALRPGNPAFLHNRAQTLFKLGRLDEARAETQNALQAEGDYRPALNLLANVLAALGDREGAERAYRRLIALQAGDPIAHYNLALLLQEGGRLDEAMAGYRTALALRPAFPEALVNLGNALKARGRHDEALAQYAEAVRQNPEHPDGLTNYATALREAGRIAEAIPLLERALKARPQSADIHNNLGIAYYERHRFADAVQCYRQALALRPDFLEARNNLGNVLSALGAQDEAVEIFRQVIAADPRAAHAHSNLGIILQERGDFGAAIACYERALEIQPDYPDAINNLGYLLQEQGRRRDAMALYERALAVNPRFGRAAYNLGLAHLAEREFERGWELHEFRLRTVPPIAPPRPFAIPAFTASDWGRGHRLAVWREQGLGDQILFSTTIPELEARGQDFVLEIDARLIPAMRRAHPGWKVVAIEESAAAFADCDRHAPLGTLAGMLRPSLASFAAQPVALLAADRARARGYRDRLSTPGAAVVGISWRSFQPSARGYLQRKKSAPLTAFMELSRRDDLRLLDLQYGDTAQDRKGFLREGGRLERLDELDLFNDVDGVLAAIEACNVVVTTSNVTAHLAGALGKRTLLVYLAANPPFHYWTADEDGRSLWYPSVQIVTGADLDTWEKALARAGELLRPASEGTLQG
jgi:tetratricopeptide (TPR) repeat protein